MSSTTTKSSLPTIEPTALGIDYTAMEDSWLIEQYVHRNDTDAIVMLLERYARFIRVTIMSVWYSAHNIIQDIEQEVALALCSSLKSFRFRSSFTTFLYRIITNTTYKALRHNRRHTKNHTSFEDTLDQTTLTIQHSNQASETIAKEQYDMLIGAMNDLNPTDRAILIYREFESYSTKQTATIMGYTESAIKSKLSRAKMKLKKLLLQRGYV